MKNQMLKYDLPPELEDLLEPDDLVSITIERNGCMYNWGVPFKNLEKLKILKESFKEKDLVRLGGKLMNILISKKAKIEFDSKTGVKELDVAVFSSESEDMQLLHSLTTEFREDNEVIVNNSMDGTKDE